MSDSPKATSIRQGLTTLVGLNMQGPPQRVPGGSVGECYACETDTSMIFLKLAESERLAMFEAEAAGLVQLDAAGVLRIPAVLGVGAHDGFALLVLEWLDLRRTNPAVEWQLGERLAELHRVTHPKYGWRQGNFIGANPQPNVWSADWLHFWRTHRIEVQMNLAIKNGADANFIERAALLNALLDGFFTSYVPQPSLLHGDLWGGNHGADEHNRPVVFDPAVYFGDRECDVAMTRLFGGFSREFYAAYEQSWALDAGASARVDLYNLYHVLNHFNLFGGDYLERAARMVNGLLAELGH